MKLFEAKTQMKVGELVNNDKFKFVKSPNAGTFVKTGNASYNVVFYKKDGETDKPANSTHFDVKVIKV